MKQFITLIKREFWEHKILIWYFPLTLALLTILPMLVILSNHVGHVSSTQLMLRFTLTYYTSPSILLFVYPLIIFTYAMSCFFTERKDKSLLFWKAMPVSNTKIVLCKVIFGVLVIPILFIIVWLLFVCVSIVLNSLFLMIDDYISVESLKGFTEMKSLFGLTLSVSLGILTFSVFMLPYYAYLMFLSIARGRVLFLFAILPFIMLVFLNMLIPESAVIYEYLLMPLELAFRVAVNVAQGIAEWLGIIIVPNKFYLAQFYDILNKLVGYSNADAGNYVLNDKISMREIGIFISSIFSSITFITLTIFARKRVQVL